MSGRASEGWSLLPRLIARIGRTYGVRFALAWRKAQRRVKPGPHRGIALPVGGVSPGVQGLQKKLAFARMGIQPHQNMGSEPMGSRAKATMGREVGIQPHKRASIRGRTTALGDEPRDGSNKSHGC